MWSIVLVPPLGFGVQEHLERLIELNAFPVGAALEPTFLAGMALQLPFAPAALLLASALLAVGHRLGRGSRRGDPRGRLLARRRCSCSPGSSPSWRGRRSSAPASGERAPPAAAVA